MKKIIFIFSAAAIKINRFSATATENKNLPLL
jgi:hypothetical protein